MGSFLTLSTAVTLDLSLVYDLVLSDLVLSWQCVLRYATDDRTVVRTTTCSYQSIDTVDAKRPTTKRSNEPERQSNAPGRS